MTLRRLAAARLAIERADGQERMANASQGVQVSWWLIFHTERVTGTHDPSPTVYNVTYIVCVLLPRVVFPL